MSATKEKATAVAVETPKFPEVEVGQTVQWFTDRATAEDRQRPVPAVVERISNRRQGMVDLLLLSAGRIARKSACRWLDDPAKPPEGNDGFWDLTSREKALDQLLDGYLGKV